MDAAYTDSIAFAAGRRYRQLSPVKFNSSSFRLLYQSLALAPGRVDSPWTAPHRRLGPRVVKRVWPARRFSSEPLLALHSSFISTALSPVLPQLTTSSPTAP
ncbi:hypothetical protein BKA80DRAFT_251492 [Phyllosticta citrichinensis]